MKKTTTIATILIAFLLVLSLAACEDNATELNSLKSITGTVTGMGENSLTIETDGQTYTFSTMGANVGEAPDLGPGVEVEIYYTGILDGTNTSNTAVKRIVQVETASSSLSSSTSDNGEEHFVTGTILDSDGASLVVRPSGQDALTFDIVGADATGANGLVIGDEVTVYYTGTIIGDDTSNATVTKLVQ